MYKLYNRVILPDVFRNVSLSFLYSGSCLKRLYLFQQAVFFTVSPCWRHFCLQRLYSLWRNNSVTYFVPKPICAWNISPRSIRDLDSAYESIQKFITYHVITFNPMRNVKPIRFNNKNDYVINSNKQADLSLPALTRHLLYTHEWF
jgi:hypothetical protein